MKKIIFIIFMLSASLVFAANEWRKGTGEDVLLGTEKINDIDKISFENIVEPAERLLANYVQGAVLTYSSGSTINITAGSVTCSNTAGTVRKMRLNTSTVSATFAGNLDTGLEAAATQYYLFANCDADADTFTVKISANATTPAGVTSYKRLGSFYNNGSSDIDASKIVNDARSLLVEVQNGVIYIKSNMSTTGNIDLNGNTISDGFLGTTTTGSVTQANDSTNYVPAGCYVRGQTRDSDGSAGSLQYACP